MRLLYFGDLREGSTSLLRYRAIEALGHQARGVGYVLRHRKNPVTKLTDRVLWRLGWPVDHGDANPRFLEGVKTRPELALVDKGVLLTKETLQRAREISPGTVFAHYNPDDPFGHAGRGGWRTFIRAIPAYDLHIVPRLCNVAEYQAHGARRVEYVCPARGYDPAYHRPLTPSPEILRDLGADVGFIGGFEKERADSLLALARAGVGVGIVGPWPRPYLHPGIKHYPREIFGPGYAEALNCFKIGLVFLRKCNRDSHTSRSIEVPASGVFMLGERTDEHLRLFEEGVEAEFFGSDEELVDKARFYLAHDAARRKIAAAGLERCRRSGYDYVSLMRRRLAMCQAIRAREA